MLVVVGNRRRPTLLAAFEHLFRRAIFAGMLFAFAGVGASMAPAADDAASSGITARPFAAPTAARGKTMFVELTPEETGVRTENRFSDPKMWGELYQEFESGSVGTGVAIGDYDGDGRADIFVVSKTESCRLFRNLGNFSFEDVTDKAGVADTGDAAAIWKSGVTFVDVNNDGWLDLYVCRFKAANLLYVNQRDGTFKEMAHSYGLDVNDASVMGAFCDYDRDGWNDVYVATNLLDSAKHPNGQRGFLFHNNRDGTFANATDRAGISGETQCHSATWWDFDNDGWPDLYVANDYGKPDKLYRNNRNGTFTDAMDRALPHTSFSSMGADIGDVNNDGLIDFLVADMAATTAEKDQRSLADARGRSEEMENSTATPKYHRNALLLNTDTGHCLEASFLAGLDATDWTWSVRFEDLDNDGRLDLAVTNGFIRDPGGDVMRDIMRAETPVERIRVMRNSPVLNETHLAFRNLGDLRFENTSAAWGLDQKGVSFGAAFGDLDDDGDLDLVYSNYESGVTVLRNDSDSGHRVIIDLRGTVSNRFGIGAIVRLESAAGVQARQLALARGYMSSSEPAVHFGLGNDTSIRRLTVAWPSGHVQTFKNVPVDRRITVTEPSGPATATAAAETQRPRASQFSNVTQSMGLDLRSREEPVSETSMQRLLPRKLNRRGPALAVGDVNGDALDDIALGGTTLDPLRVLNETASGKFAAATAPRAAGHAGTIDDGPVLLFDADGDGKNDLLVTKGGNALPQGAPEYEPKLFFGDGRGGFRAAPDDALPPLLDSIGALAAADFDRDGRLDLFLGGRVLSGEYPLAPSSALLVNRGGKFDDATDRLAPGLRDIGMVTSALWSDADGDGWLDLLLTLEWGQVKCFHNNQGKGFADWTEKTGFAAAGSGWWTSLAAADFNGDGRIDYVAGNLGLNTQYQASAQHPALLFLGEFKDGAAPQIIEAFYEGEKIFPWRSRRDMVAAIPALAKKFPKTDDYAKATLSDIFGEQKLAAAERFAATEFRSGVFLSQADGTFRFEPLPRIAQIAPTQGVVAGDFDGDGFADIYAAQNSYAPIPAVGRFDGGLSQLLRGDGRGHFTPATPLESGLIVTGDAKALVVLDFNQDGWPDFLVTQNNSTALAFRNSGVTGRKSLRVQLRGAAGNPTAIGARITLELANGAMQTSEINAGSGLYSQSAAASFFGFPESNPPKRIRVRWPSGAATEHATPPAGSATLTLTAPAS